MSRLLKSSKFWAAIVAAAINIGTFVVATYYPHLRELFTVIVVSLDGVFAVVIGAIAYEDGKEKEGLAAAQTFERASEPFAEPERE